MLIKVKKEVEEMVEVQTPCWLADKLGSFYHITEDGDFIRVSNGLIVLWEKDNPKTQEQITEAVKRSHSCTESQFKEMLDKQLFKLEDTYTRA